MTQLRDSLKTLIQNAWTLSDGADFVAGRNPCPLDGENPLIRVYHIGSPASARGGGYDSRTIRHRYTVDVRSRSQAKADAAKDEVRRILWVNRVRPWAGYGPLEFDDGTDHGGGPQLGVWTIEVTIMEHRQRVN